MQRFLENLAHAICEANEHGRLPETTDDMPTGLSGDSIVGLLQRLPQSLSKQDGVCYVEIGVFRGLTLLSTARANPAFPCYGIDNFSLFDEQGENLAHVESTAERHDLTNAHVINADFEDALMRLSHETEDRKISILFVDGPHDYRSQLMSLLKARPMLSDEAIILVDDANYAHVRQANADFLACCPEFRLAFEAYTRCHPANMSDEEKSKAMAGWWNGVNVIVHDPTGTLPARYPPTAGKICFEASHNVFRHEFAERANEILRFASSLADASDDECYTAAQTLRASLAADRADHPMRYKHQNTGSADLPQFRLHVPNEDSHGVAY